MINCEGCIYENIIRFELPSSTININNTGETKIIDEKGNSLDPWLKHKDLMIIGETPTPKEIREGRLMNGKGAEIINDTMDKIQFPIDKDNIHWTTALKCCVPRKKGRKIDKDAMKRCKDHLVAEIKEVKPKMIIVCGATAYATLTGETGVKIKSKYGQIENYKYDDSTAKLITIMNPGVLMYSPNDYKPFLNILQSAAHVFTGGEKISTGETKYTVLQTEDEVKQLWYLMLDKYKKANEKLLVSFDIETTGLDYRYVEFLVLGICFEKNHTYVLPRRFMKLAHNFITDVPWTCIWQNGMYDKKVMWRRKLANVQLDEDTQYLHYILDETSEHSLEYQAMMVLNAEPYKYKMNQNWTHVNLESYDEFFDALCERVAVDCDYTLQLYKVYKEEYSKEENAPLDRCYKELIIPAANFLARVEQNGILIWKNFLYHMDGIYQEQLDVIKVVIEELASIFWDPIQYMEDTKAKSAPDKFNAGSSKQVRWMVFTKLRLKPRINKKTDSGERSTAKEVLRSIENPPELIEKILEYKKVQKEHSTYVLGLLKWEDEDGRVRSDFTLHVTATGRLSSKEPNVQNQPSGNTVGNTRRAFIAPPGYIMAEVDYSGAELRWLAYLSECPVLSKVFIDDRNLHNETAISLYGEGYSKAQKLRAKAVNFGIPYGREAQSFVDEFNITMDEAISMIDGWKKTYYGATEYLDWCAEQVMQGNYMETKFGRRRRFGLVTERSIHGLNNEARNFPIQSSSSDLLLSSAIKMEPKLIEEYGTTIINLIHDSALMYIPADPVIIDQVKFYTNKVMTERPIELFDCPIPFKTDFEIGINWGDLPDTEYDHGMVTTSEGLVIPFEDWYANVLEEQAKEDAQYEV